MDSSEIRKKTKASAGAANPAAAPPPPPSDPARDGVLEPEPPQTVPAAREVSAGAMSAAEFAARLQELPPTVGAGGRQFVTWRPGSAARAIATAPPEDFRSAAGGDPAPASPLDAFFDRPDEDAPSLGELAEVPAAVAEVIEEYLTFFLGGEEYAVAIGDVREVLKAPPITEVPRAPADVVGVVTVRGEVVAVFDPRRRLGLSGAPPEGARLVVVDAGEGPCALLVDRVASVVRLPAGRIEPCPEGVARSHADCLAGIGRERARSFTVLDVRALLKPAGAERREPT